MLHLHLEAYGKTAVNYNRDIEVFPVLNTMFEQILGESPYKSPTDMGVNMVGNCIFDDEAVITAANQEIVRRYYNAMCNNKKGNPNDNEVYTLELLMKQSKLTSADRPVIAPAVKKAEETGNPAAAIELNDGTIITGKTSELLGACAAMLLNTLKTLGGIDDSVHLISPEVIEPIQHLKVHHLGNVNPRLHIDEVLIALSISAATSENAKKALAQLEKLKGLEAHSSVILSQVDTMMFKKLGVNLTSEPEHQGQKLYRKK